MFKMHSSRRVEMALARLEILLHLKSPGVIQSAEVLHGIKRQLAMALPELSKTRRRFKQRGMKSLQSRIESIIEAIDSPVNTVIFENLRKTVIELARLERDRLDILAETHLRLTQGYTPEDIIAQLEHRFENNGIRIISELDPERNDFFVFHGKGRIPKVKNPAYCAIIPGENTDEQVIIRQGDIELGFDEDTSQEDNTLKKTTSENQNIQSENQGE